MLGDREPNINDYLTVFRRRVWVIVAFTLTLPVLAYMASYAVPKRYTSRSMLLIDQQKVPDSLMKSMGPEDIAKRVGGMQEQMLSRSHLQAIIEKNELFKKEWGKTPMEDLVARLRKNITLTSAKPLVSNPKDDLPGFTIDADAADPQQAQKICADVTALFTGESAQRAERTDETTQLLSRQLEVAKKKLDEEDGRLAAFKTAHLDQLPEREQTNLNLIPTLSSQLEAANQAVGRAQQDKQFAEQTLVQQLQDWQNQQAGNSTGTIETQLAQAQSQLLTLRARYTDDHPDVIKLQNDIRELERKRVDAQKHQVKIDPLKTPTGVEPLPIQQLRSQINQDNQIIRDKTREAQNVQAQIAHYQASAAMSPMAEQEYKRLTRDYQSAQTFYNDLLTKKSEAELVSQVEKGKQGEQFRLLDPPSLPESPSFPKRTWFAGGGLAFGLCFGLIFAMFLETRDKALYNEADVEQQLGLPTLAMLPRVDSGRSALRYRREKPEEPRIAVGA